uniref:Uncharacterized protein n=1 Tax=Candidatus Kentrum sp. LFY TaxID=2126342 RepID=A0A450UQI4_9GAMM|nr:MAG: Protein of unknown function (DUF2934) [Candidatus Kentron sp. LFY]VFJ94812.1 MAG: Protein of unknown function (DUF2934) [Candidatus Kentron sp. LFY]
MANISERPAVCVMDLKTRSNSGKGSRLCQTGHDRGKANTGAYGSRLMQLNGSRNIPPEERWQAIAVMAYHLARRRGFVGKPVKYWLAAEAKVDAELAIQRSTII